MMRLLTFAMLSVLSLAAPLSPARAADWPTKPVRIVVPFPAGGATDVPARLLGERLGRMWGQNVVVDNRPGVGGALAAGEVARAAPDGYTLLFPSGSVMTVNPFVYRKLPYDADKDFAPVSIVVSGPQVLVVAAASPYKTIEDLIAAARAPGAKLTFGHAGNGSQSHVANEYFLQQARIEATGVPYKGDPPAITDMIGGSIDFGVMSLGASMGLIKSGKLRALGVTSKEPVSQLAGVPPIASVLPGFDNSGWFGLVAPAAVPPDVLRKISEDTQTALKDPELKSRLDALGFRIVASTPQAMAEQMALERKRWEALIRDRNIAQLQ